MTRSNMVAVESRINRNDDDDDADDRTDCECNGGDDMKEEEDTGGGGGSCCCGSIYLDVLRMTPCHGMYTLEPSGIACCWSLFSHTHTSVTRTPLIHTRACVCGKSIVNIYLYIYI